MAIGQFLLFLSACYYTSAIVAQTLLIVGLVVLIFGNGFFKPNISTMVGTLYHPDDKRKDSAYTIFYMGINLGGMLAPLWCGFIGNTGNPEDFKWGFLSACVGMLISTVIFQIFKNKYLKDPFGREIGVPPVQPMSSAKSTEEKKSKKPAAILNPRAIIAIVSTIIIFLLFAINYDSFNDSSIGLFYQADWIGALIYSATIVMPIFMITDSSLTTLEKKRIMVIYIIAFFIIFFWAAFEQAGASLTFFADEQTDRHIFGWDMPAAYFQSFNAMFIILLAPLFTMLWGALGRRNAEPSSPAKQAIGLLLLSLGYLVIALGVSGVEGDTKVSMLWLVSLYFIHTMGELCLSPIGLSMVNKLSPARFASLLMGIWYLSTAVANKFSGVLSGYYPEGGVAKSFVGYEIATLSDFFMLFVVMSGVAAIILFALTKYLNKLIKE